MHLFLSHSFNYSIKKLLISEIKEIIESGIIELSKSELDELQKKDPFQFKSWAKGFRKNYKVVSEHNNILVLDISDTLKNNLPTVIFNSTHIEGNKSNSILWEELTGKLVIDLDIVNIPLDKIKGNFKTHEELAETCQEIIEADIERLKGLTLSFISASKKGIKLIYNINSKDLNASSKRIIDDLNASLGINLYQFKGVVDLSSNRLKQQCYLNKSNSILYNPKALFLPEKKEQTKKIVIKDIDKKIEQLEKSILSGYSPSDLVYKTGFDNQIVRFIRSLKYLQLPEDLIFTATNKWLSYPDNRKHGVKIIYRDKIPAKIKESFKGVYQSRTGITHDETKEEQEIFQHWWSIDKGKIICNQAKLNDALIKYGFTRILEDKNESHLYVIKDNIISLVVENFTDLTYHLHEHFFPIFLKDNAGVWIEQADDIMTATKNILITNVFKYHLPSFSISDCDKEGKNNIKIYLKNGVVNITSDKVQLIEYKDLKHPILDKKIIKKWLDHSAEYQPRNYKDYKSLSFYKNVSENNPDKFKSLCSIIGYAISKHKNKGDNKHITLIDGFSENQHENGGSGKSVIARNIDFLRNVLTLHKERFTRFIYQNADIATEVINLEDINYSDISERDLRNFNDTIFTIEKKSKTPITLTDYNCPRLIMTTNYTSDSEETADERRRITFCLPAHYNIKNTVKKELGHWIFNEYTQEDWYIWFNFMIYCCQIYLKYGVVQIDESEKLKNKKLSKTLNNLDNEELQDFIREKCYNVRTSGEDYNFKLTDIMKNFPKNKMGKIAINNLIEREAKKENLTYKKDTIKNGQRFNSIIKEKEIKSRGGISLF